MRRNMSGNLGLYKYLWPGSVEFQIYNWLTLDVLFQIQFEFLYGMLSNPEVCHFNSHN